MFSPSDYNDAVPQFTNGNYANTPINPLYVEEPDAVNYNRGSEPLQTLPAQWWNWLLNKITSKLNKLNVYVKNIFDELTQLLSLVGVTPDATEEDITTGQLKDMFQNGYPLFLGNNFKFESVLQGRTRGVMVAPNDTWTNNTDTISLTGGFGIINSYKKVTFADCSLILPNDNAVHYIVSDIDGAISIEDTLEDDVILVGLCHNKEYCLLIDNNPDQCKDNIILKKWFGQNKITQGFVSVLQSYYNTTINSVETKVFIDTVSGEYGIESVFFNNCTISIDTINSNTGIESGNFDNCTFIVNTINSSGRFCYSGTFNNCNVSVDMANGNVVAGGIFNNCIISTNTIGGGHYVISGGSIFNNCTISVDTVNSVFIGDGTFNNCNLSANTVSGKGVSTRYGIFNNCTISIKTVSGSNAMGVDVGNFNNCTISIKTVSGGGSGVVNNPNMYLYLTRISCTSTTSLSNTKGKLNVLNDTVLHAS